MHNIVCCQPFGCLPNHIVAKGMTRKIKDKYPMANIVAVDYDPSATKVNQENRLKLMLSNARLSERFAKEDEETLASERQRKLASSVHKQKQVLYLNYSNTGFFLHRMLCSFVKVLLSFLKLIQHVSHCSPVVYLSICHR